MCCRRRRGRMAARCCGEDESWDAAAAGRVAAALRRDGRARGSGGARAGEGGQRRADRCARSSLLHLLFLTAALLCQSTCPALSPHRARRRHTRTPASFTAATATCCSPQPSGASRPLRQSSPAPPTAATAARSAREPAQATLRTRQEPRQQQQQPVRAPPGPPVSPASPAEPQAPPRSARRPSGRGDARLSPCACVACPPDGEQRRGHREAGRGRRRHPRRPEDGRSSSLSFNSNIRVRVRVRVCACASEANCAGRALQVEMEAQ